MGFKNYLRRNLFENNELTQVREQNLSPFSLASILLPYKNVFYCFFSFPTHKSIAKEVIV